ncbi:MAG: LemA family protein [Gemmatimonadales bacterium]
MTLALVVAAVLVGWTIWTFNRLTHLHQLAANAWADIDVQLKRRHDLIPQLVAVVKGHAGYERDTLEAVVEARNRALEASGPAAKSAAEAPVAAGVQRLLAIAEAYPDLRAMQSFRDLQKGLSEVEDHLQNSRRYYNAVVRDLNTKIAQFPSNLVAHGAGFEPRQFFGLEHESERAVPNVSVERTP